MTERLRASRWWVKALLLLALLAGLGLRSQEMRPVLQHASERDNPRPELRDFRDTVIEPGHDLRDGENPYDPEPYLARHPGHQELDLYAPQVFVLAVPASFLPLALAQVLWLLVLIASVGVIAWLAWRLAGRRPDAWVVAGTAGALLATGPAQQGFETGNVSLPLAAAIAASLYIGARSSLATGALVAAVMIKPQLALPLIVLLALARAAPRAVAIGIAIAAALALIPTIAILRAAGSVTDLADSLSRNLDYSTKMASDIANRDELRRSDLWGFIGKVFKVNPTTATQLLTLVVVCGLAIFVLRRAGATSRPLRPLELALFVSALLLAMPHYSYDLTLLLLAVIAISAAVVDRETTPVSLAGACGLLCLVPLLHLGSVDSMLDRVGADSLTPWLDAAALIAVFVTAAVAVARSGETPTRPSPDQPLTAAR